MDSSSDKYLHKKFKKQLSIESRNAAKTRISSSDQCETETPPKPEDQTDNNKSVPNNSTNQNSIPVPNQIYASSLLRSSISVSDGPSDISKEHTNPHSTNNTISYLTSTTRVASPNIDDIQLKKSLNFDTLSVNDPKPEQSSSILQNCVYITNASPEKSKDVHDSTQLSDKSPGGKHVCPYCNLACSKPSVLQKHIRAHTNERPYPCDSCGFSFKTRSNLYKHCRSRTHANRVMGNKVQEIDADAESKNDNDQNCFQIEDNTSKNEEVLTEAMMQEQKSKPYKPRFHTSKVFFENTIKENISNEKTPEVPQIPNSDLLSLHINELINKNNSIVNSSDSILLRKKSIETNTTENENLFTEQKLDEPLNLSNKNRKRCLSEVMEPRAQKSLIKELLLKNLYADSNMQCQYCKMIFQTVTELELHKFRSCKGFTISGAKYTRSSSVNVASILTHNKNAFDDIPHISNAVFPLKSPGPFLGKTSLVESDKTKSFSFEDVLPASFHVLKNRSSHLDFEKDKKQHVKLFGGELKISHSSCGGDEKSFEGKNSDDFNRGYVDYGGKVSENRVIKSSLQSGATVLTNKSVFREGSDAMRTYEDTGGSGRCVEGEISRANYKSSEVSGIGKYTNIADFSQKAVNLLTPNLKQLKLSIPPELSGYKPPPQSTTFMDTSFEIPDNEETKRRLPENERYIKPVTVLKTTDPVFHQAPLSSPVNLYVNGKVVRYVPGMPGPVIAETPVEAVSPNKPITPSSGRYQISPLKNKPEEKNQKPSESLKIVVDNVEKKPPFSSEQQQKFTRPNSLALKPSLSVMKQHHGLTPTMLNQILISPDTPRVAKKYNQHMLAGNCFSYLGLKSSTKPVYCTLNKPQPVYVPLYKKLSMYSEWRQQDNKSDKLYVSAYDSRQRHTRYSVAGKCSAEFVVHSNYKYTLPDLIVEEQKVDLTSGNCESSDEYCNSRGRNQLECGLKCKKPSELKKHLKTHSLPYCYGNSKHKLKTKPRKTKVNNKTSGSSSSNLQNTIQSSESDTDDSGMDSSDESTRQQEHEAAYGLLSLSQKALQPKSDFESANGLNAANRNVFMVSSKYADGCGFMNNEELVHVTKKSFAKNKFLDEHATLKFDAKQLTQLPDKFTESSRKFESSLALRPLTYPYTSPVINENVNNKFVTSESKQELKSIRHFQVFQNYANEPKTVINLVDTKQVGYEDGSKIMLKSPPVVKINDVVMSEPEYPADLRKRKISVIENGYKPKIYRNENEVMDLSVKMVVVDDSSNHDTNNARYYNRAQENAASFEENNVNVSFLRRSPSPRQFPAGEYDNSAMETLADIATKQEKLDKNLLAKNVASEFLKLATKNEYPGESPKDAAFSSSNELMVKSEENKRCTICSKSFNKPSQLRLHMNIHYLERPFRCDSCSVSFRTKGHLQKHERSASHHNKLSSSPTLSTSEPRPFKCSDCNIAFRIHGHLAKHLRSKMHIMRLECLAKIPFGLYAELERSNNLLTEINTTDGDQCLESLKFLAKKVFVNDPIKLNQIMEVSEMDENSS